MREGEIQQNGQPNSCRCVLDGDLPRHFVVVRVNCWKSSCRVGLSRKTVANAAACLKSCGVERNFGLSGISSYIAQLTWCGGHFYIVVGEISTLCSWDMPQY